MKKIKFFCDPMIAIEAICAFISFCAMFILFVYVILDIGYFRSGLFTAPASFGENLSFTILFSVCIPGTIICSFILFPLMARMELDEEGIQLKQPFKKYSKIPYSKLNFFRLAFYNHGGHIRFFLVMSQYAVSQDELMQINRVQNSDTLAKIKLTKKNYKRLCEILPEERRNMLEKAMNGNGKDGMFDAATYAKRKAKQEKLKKKKRRKRK